MTRNWWALTWLVTRRELRDRGRARSFWIASALLLVAVAAAAIIPALLQGSHSSSGGTESVGIVGGDVAPLSTAIHQAAKASGSTIDIVVLPDVAAARAQLLAGKLSAVLVSNTEVLVKQQSVSGGSSSNPDLADALADIGALRKFYPQLPPAAAGAIIGSTLALPVRGLTPPPRGMASRFTGLAVAILIYVIILTYGIRITIGVGEEKATRVVEVLLTTLRPVQLLAGKVIGMGLLAVGQIAALVGTYLLLGHLAGSDAVRGASTSVVIAAGIWLILGYAFYCTAYAAAGSLITRQSDAYNAALPLQIPLILAYVLCYTVIYASTVNGFYHVLAFIPFTAPVAMPVLIAVGAAPTWQVAISAAISLAATVGMARLAATIYGRAILQTGSRLKARQVLRSSS
jgi:ABC-2 type transport system permease protein